MDVLVGKAISAVVVCTMSRFLLNIQDRLLFCKRKIKVSFHTNILLCCVFPLLFACLFNFFINGIDSFSSLVEHSFSIWAFLNGFGLFLTGTMFCYGFSRMEVKSVAAIARIPDVLLPLIFFLVHGSFNVNGFIFNILLFCSFLPILIHVFNRSKIHWISAVSIITSLIFQIVVIQSLFTKTPNLNNFLIHFLCTSLWRAVFGFLFYTVTSIRKGTNDVLNTNFIPHFFRGLPAFLAQASQLYGATLSVNIGLFSWPILNSAPLIASLLAHKLLEEKMSSREFLSVYLFVGVIGTWTITHYMK